MWEKVERTKSKELATPPTKPKTPHQPSTKTPTKPSDTSKPPHPYEMSDSEAKDYRWRWVEAGLIDPDYPDTDELVRYTLEVVRKETDDPMGYIAAVDADEQKQKRLARRAYRMAVFKGLRQ